jgi:hypothetical protein
MNLSQMMKGQKMGLAFVGVLGSVCATGCLAHTALDPTKVIEFKISKSGLTRISIDNDSIEDVYAYPAEPDLITHHKSGHVFVTPDDLEIPVYLTVITRRGAAQDLRLIPTPKKAEPILLRFEGSKIDSSPVTSLSSLSPQDASVHLLGQFIKGKIPSGFIAIGANEVSRGEGPIEAILDQTYQNDQFRVLVFSIKNESSERQTLDNRGFWGKEDLASAFDHSTLNPQETARLFVIQQR